MRQAARSRGALPGVEVREGEERMDVAEGELPRRSTTRTGGRVLRETMETVLLAALLYLGVRALVQPYAVEGASMAPNLHDQERLLVNRNAYLHFDANPLWNFLPGEDHEGADVVYPFGGPERGDIVVLEPPTNQHADKPYVKRIIGLPGETIAFRNGAVYVDGERLDESYIDGAITRCSGEYCELTVPDGQVYVLGDNRTNSADSRTFGPVGIDRILGKVFFANWPLDDIGPVPHADYEE